MKTFWNIIKIGLFLALLWSYVLAANSDTIWGSLLELIIFPIIMMIVYWFVKGEEKNEFKKE